MRFIDVGQLRPLLPADWEDRARNATADVRAAPSGERAAVVEKHADLWRELKNLLQQLSHGKCWYCELRQERSDNAVDHFRPKNRVAECAGHEGYWWCAFDWHNYRFSCTFCNSRRRDREGGTAGGKHDHFPLLDEAGRARDENDDLDLENPELLDPTSHGDPTLLYFGDDGYPCPREHDATKPQHRRARTSIELYHLDHIGAVEARLELLRRIKRLVALGNDQYDHTHQGNPEAVRAYSDVAEELKEMMADQSPLSMAARDMIRGQRDDRHSWIDGL